MYLASALHRPELEGLLIENGFGTLKQGSLKWKPLKFF